MAVAMLTGMVNIAVFAAFRWCVGDTFRVSAEFKPICGLHELDVSRYGRQRRQETAMVWQWMARSAAKTARMGGVFATSRPSCPRLRWREDGRICHDMRLLRCWRRAVTPW